ncbi:sulfite exporter TauE/SafE family protein [Oryzomonas japonica]|uniref:Probable membrane transporter protein n=1 Tax=Oryzomonas japonica TaxID=2603858 RepID=A0A7J4ZVW0_9BACT|nr:sulfite exporter TauE/SafE family protein [Oryzomonas japonica]KAB0667727.1 sulfite exporter TauE/SafE family protein [Oryzomonas japonica]
MAHIAALLGLGILAGLTSGLIGIGGGIIIVPVLVLFFGFSQQLAQGTTLALMVPPLGAFAAWTYYRQGYVDIKTAGLICLGFLVGSVLGADFAIRLPTEVLTRTFGAILVAIGLKMLFEG